MEASSPSKAPENPQGERLWALLDVETVSASPVAMGEEQSPPDFPEDWDPLTAEEEQATVDATADDVEKTEETSSLDAAMSGLDLSSEAPHAAPIEPAPVAAPAGTASAGGSAPVSARRDSSGKSASFRKMD